MDWGQGLARRHRWKWEKALPAPLHTVVQSHGRDMCTRPALSCRPWAAQAPTACSRKWGRDEGGHHVLLPVRVHGTVLGNVNSWLSRAGWSPDWQCLPISWFLATSVMSLSKDLGQIAHKWLSWVVHTGAKPCTRHWRQGSHCELRWVPLSKQYQYLTYSLCLKRVRWAVISDDINLEEMDLIVKGVRPLQ